MKKLSRNEMKNVVGGLRATGGGTICVDCIDTPVGTQNGTQNNNVMCMAIPPGSHCHESYGSQTNGIACGNSTTGDFVFTHCPVV